MNDAQRKHNGFREHIVDSDLPSASLDLWPGDRVIQRTNGVESVWRVDLNGQLITESKFNKLYR